MRLEGGGLPRFRQNETLALGLVIRQPAVAQCRGDE